MIRDIEVKDLIDLDRIFKEYSFPIPDIPNFAQAKVICSDDELLGFGGLKVTTEAVLALDPSSSKLKRARAVKEMFDYLLPKLLKMNLDDTHVFCDVGKDFEEFLIKHFNFARTTGQPLYWRI